MSTTAPTGHCAPHTDPEQFYTLPAHYYYDREIFEREKEAVFFRTWQYVGHAEQVATPGDYVTRDIHDQSIIVIRGDDGILRAFYNVCSHRAHQLLSGRGHTKIITCPYHAWSHEIDGRLRYARNSEHVKGFEPEKYCLKQVKIEVFLNFLFVNLDPDAPTLKSQAGGLAEELGSFSPRLDGLTLAHRRAYDIKANWKNLIDNYSECYHCPVSHRDFAAKVVQMDSYRITLHDIHHSHRSRAKPPERGAYDFDPAASNHAQEFSGWYLWPNLAIEVYPGGNLNVFHIVPVEPERSIQYIEWYFADPTPTEEESAVIKYLHETVRTEDVALCESVQRGLHSRGYQPGRLIVDPARTDASEHAVHHFQSLVRQALQNREDVFTSIS